ncbi:MAG: glycogen synthase GlgA [Candidatus Marinimicrobia bacterium CG08_land_8_20_14_0_20_45_22]|nr:MAG: glycogen synthase GlgA [Candidatus Marinimicrobia bacterium CG08_land_8_20_14_0_20_45_22]
MNVLFVAAEVSPFSKVGGLGDVIGALPLALVEKGVSVKVVSPAYGAIDRTKFTFQETSVTFEIEIGGIPTKCSLLKWNPPEQNNLELYFVENEEFYSCKGIYTNQRGNPYINNPERFVLLQKCALKLITELNWIPDIIHCHDNHAALIPVYLKTLYAEEPIYQSIKTVLTIHNIAYQSVTSFDKKYVFGLPSYLFAPAEPMEWYDQINPLKAGIIFADVVTTVSQTHAQELMTNFTISAGLKGVLVSRKKPVVGILNGVDYSTWNPAFDPEIVINYSPKNLAGRRKNKQTLILETDLKNFMIEKPLIGIVSRLVEQKGIDLILEGINRMMAMDVGLILLGSGEEKYHTAFKDIAARFPGRVSVNFGYNNTMCHKILAGSDVFLMPSRYEPCGITQMLALKYGAVPVVHKTGGLADTIKPWNGQTGNGFLFDDYSVDSLLASLGNALGVFRNKSDWKTLMTNGMTEDFSWDKSSDEYLKVYEDILKA